MKLSIKEIRKLINERFGEPIGDAPSLSGVADERDEGVCCEGCGKMLEMDEAVGSDCNPMNVEEAKKKGPSKKTAKSWVKGTKKFSDKVKKAKKAGMKNPEGFAAWMEKKATGKWPSQH